MSYKQLPLDGAVNDFIRTETLLVGHLEFLQAVNNFFVNNQEYNPRQLMYYVNSIVNDAHLNVLLGFLGNTPMEQDTKFRELS